MKMNKQLLGAIAIIFALTACKNELNVNAPWQDITVLYGLLDQRQDTNWVRIHRGYLGDQGIYGGNQEPDSLYYKNLVVTLFEEDQNGNQIASFTLDRDVPQPGLDSGFFTTEGYHAYRYVGPLNTTSLYRIRVEKPDGEGENIISETPLVSNFRITKPLSIQRLTFGVSGQDFHWNQAANGRMYQAYLRFHYVELNEFDKKDSIRKFVDYDLSTFIGSNLDGDGSIKTNVGYDEFYRFLQNKIGEANGVVRFYRGIDIYISAAADDLATYINVSQPAQGIVQDKPLFTNVQNGIGIFSSRTGEERLGMNLSGLSQDSLIRGIYTCELQFGRPSAGDTCYCLVPGKFICN